MGTISRTGITGGGTIQPSHVTNIIDALDGTSTTTTVIATGSFSGSLVGGPVNVSTVTANSITSNGPIVGTSLTIDTGNPYGISVTADSMSFNSSNEDFNTEIKHYGGLASTIFSANGISTNNRIVATSFTGSLQGTASFAVSASRAISSSFATTASFALNAGGGGGGIFALTGSTYSTTNNLEITGSLRVTAGVTASLQGTASFATTASFALNAGGGGGGIFPFTGSAQVTGSMGITGSLRIGTANNQYALMVTGSTFTSGSFIGFVGELDTATNLTANKNGIINLAGLGGSGFNGKFVLPNNQPDQPVAGSVFWDDAAGILYVYKESDPPGWTQI